MSRTNETRHVTWHETCTYKCRLDVSVCNNKNFWNNDKCRREWKELIYKGRCDDCFVWNPSLCGFECNKSCDTGEYLDYENWKCRKRLVDKLVEECSEDINDASLWCNFKWSWKSMQVLYDIHNVVNYNVRNNYGHWLCMHLLLLEYHKKLF